MILRGGANVYPAEVERVLNDVPGVAASAVLGVPDERLGERVVAIVEPMADAVIDADAVRAHCLANLAKYKVPERFVVVDAFPRNAMGKILRTASRRFSDDAGSAGDRPVDAVDSGDGRPDARSVVSVPHAQWRAEVLHRRHGLRPECGHAVVARDLRHPVGEVSHRYHLDLLWQEQQLTAPAVEGGS